MKKLLMTAAVAMLAATAPLQAHAAPNFDYRGGCSFETLNDTTPGSVLGGQNVWNGGVVVAVRAVAFDTTPDDQVPATPSPTTAISVDCKLIINGGAPTTVLSASGTGAAANADQIQFTAARGSVIQLCDYVTVGGESVVNCGTATETPVVPQPVQDLIQQVIDALNHNVLEQIDPTICPVLATLSPGVPGVLPINSEGDVFLVGTGPTDKIYDCPPYDPPTA